MTLLRTLGIAMVAVCLACGSDPGPAPDVRTPDSRGRFIASEPTEIIHPGLYSEDRTTGTIAAGEWRSKGATNTAVSAGSVIINSPKRQKSIEAEIDVDASDVDWLLVEFDRRPRGPVHVQWTTRPRGGFNNARSISLGTRDGVRFKSSKYRFALSSHPSWNGPVDRIRVRVSDTPDRSLTLGRVSYGGREAVSDVVGVLEPAWKVEIGHEVRNGLAALPGSPRLLRAAAPAGSRFEVAVGLEETARQPVTFRVLAETESAAPEVILESTIDPGSGEHGRWVDLGADLGGSVDGEVSIVLETSIDDVARLGSGLAWWSMPRISRPYRDSELPNIVVFCIDTLRSDRMGLYGNRAPTSPELERWIEENGVVFETVIASAPWTLPSHVSMFSGITALRHGVNHAFSGTPGFAAWEQPRSVRMIAEILREQGYHTAAFTGGAYLHPRWGFARGFDRYAYWPDREHAEEELETNLDGFRDWATNQIGPWFAFVHTYEVHDPYHPRAEFFERVAPGLSPPTGRASLELLPEGPQNGFRYQNRWIFRETGGDSRPLDTHELETVLPALYDSHVAYTDAAIGGLLNRWRDLGLDPQTAIVVTSDHGQAFGETTDAGHTGLHEVVINVPLLLALPDRSGAGRRIPGQARLADLLPTLLDAAGIDAPEDIDGISLLPALRGESPLPVRMATSVSSTANVGVSLRSPDSKKLVFNNTAWEGAEPRSVAYDVARDPSESDPLASSDPTASDLSTLLKDLLQKRAPGLVMTATASDGAPLEIDLAGPLIQKNGVKTLPGSPAHLEWRGAEHAGVIVPEGWSVEIRFEKIFGRRLEITARQNDTSGKGSVFDLPVLSVRDDGPIFIAYEGGSLVERDPGARRDGSPGLFFEWRGSTASGDQTDELDSELSEQLRALGYLE